jgi:hypothetical protein
MIRPALHLVFDRCATFEVVDHHWPAVVPLCDYWFRQKEKPEQAMLAIALMPLVAMAGLLIMLIVVLMAHL